MIDEFNKITSRHAAKAISHLTDVDCPKCAIDAVRREFWFLKDDIVTIINTVNKGLSKNAYSAKTSPKRNYQASGNI